MGDPDKSYNKGIECTSIESKTSKSLSGSQMDQSTEEAE
ncbi:MAG: hypothetical protein ACD_37C00623G0002 [uncultured bacterium]|nr:MAG: hypothetical protein ACD_37C00623G0002 [uncultured bacterium]